MPYTLEMVPEAAEPADHAPTSAPTEPPLFRSVAQLAGTVAHEINHPSEVIQSNGNTLAAYADVFRRLFDEYERFLEAYGERDRAAINTSLQKIRALRRSEDVAFIVEDLGDLVKESRAGTERLRLIADRLREIADLEQDHDCAERVWAVMREVCSAARNDSP